MSSTVIALAEDGSSVDRAYQQQQSAAAPSSLYELQKLRDLNMFGQYFRNNMPSLALSQCSGAHMLEFLQYLDQFGKTKVYGQGCPYFGHPHPLGPCRASSNHGD